MWTDEIRRGTKGFDSLTIKFRGSQSIFPETNTGTSKFDQRGNWELLFVAFLETNDEKQRCWNCWWLRRSSIHWFYVCNHNSAFACRSNLLPDWSFCQIPIKGLCSSFPWSDMFPPAASCCNLCRWCLWWTWCSPTCRPEIAKKSVSSDQGTNYTSNLKIASLWRFFLRPKKVYETPNRCARFRLESRFGSLYSMPSLNRFLHTSRIHKWISKFGPIIRGPTWKAYNLIEKNLKIRNLQGDSSSFSGKGCEKTAESNRFQGNDASEQVKARSPGNLQRIQQLASGNTVTADARNCSQWSFIEAMEHGPFIDEYIYIYTRIYYSYNILIKDRCP